jgi:hypothetical protein
MTVSDFIALGCGAVTVLTYVKAGPKLKQLCFV